MSGLAGARVLVTRAAHQAQEFGASLRAAGAEPIFAPMIAIGPPDDRAALTAAAAAVSTYAWVVFTSRNAVEMLLSEVRAAEGMSQAWNGVRVAAIGPKTAAALREHGVEVALVPRSYVNESVAAELIARTSVNDRVLIVRAQEARDVLPASLRDAGRRVDVVAAYATRPLADPKAPEKARRADIVTFTSASTVSAFCACVPNAAHVLGPKVVAAIGPITARAARHAGIRVDVVADAFTTDGLIAALTMRAAATA